MIMYALSAILLLIMSNVNAAAEKIFPPLENAYISIPEVIPMNSDEYTSLVINANAIAIIGGKMDSHPVSIIVNSIQTFSYTLY